MIKRKLETTNEAALRRFYENKHKGLERTCLWVPRDKVEEFQALAKRARIKAGLTLTTDWEIEETDNVAD